MYTICVKVVLSKLNLVKGRDKPNAPLDDQFGIMKHEFPFTTTLEGLKPIVYDSNNTNKVIAEYQSIEKLKEVWQVD